MYPALFLFLIAPSFEDIGISNLHSMKKRTDLDLRGRFNFLDKRLRINTHNNDQDNYRQKGQAPQRMSGP